MNSNLIAEPPIAEPIPDPIAQLRVEYRGILDELPPSELTVPSHVVRRRSSHWAIELDDHIPRDVAFQLIRGAIDAAFDAGELAEHLQLCDGCDECRSSRVGPEGTIAGDAPA